MKRHHVTFAGLFAFSALALAVCLLLSVGVTWARYERTMEMTLVMHVSPVSPDDGDQAALFGYVPEEDSYIPLREAWSASAGNTYSVSAALTNGTKIAYCAYDQQASLILYVTEGITDADNLTISLQVGQTIYYASATAIVSGSYLDASGGGGWIYRFYNNAGEELRWTLPGGRFVSIPMTLTFSGGGESGAALAVQVRALPV